jgi:hypothetical protein
MSRTLVQRRRLRHALGFGPQLTHPGGRFGAPKDATISPLVAGPAPADEADEAFDVWLRERGTSRRSLASTDCEYDDVPWVQVRTRVATS